MGLHLGRLLLLGLALAAALPAQGEVHVLLLNGGGRAESNYLSHLHHVQDMVSVLERRGISRDRIAVFSADGEDQAPDLAVRDVLPAGFWLVDGLEVGQRLKPRTAHTDTRWPGMPLLPASKPALREWFESSRKRLGPGDRLFVFVTDHGTENAAEPDNGAISLWQDKLTVHELRRLLDLLPDGVKSTFVMSQCFSGTFAALMYDGELPSGDRCGFFSTTRDLEAYGCYPEGRDRDRLGHAFAFVSALERNASTDEAHLEVLVQDDTPDVPLRTSDVFLERVLEHEAETTDRLLETAWTDRAAWEPEIRLLDRIAAAFGMWSPRSLAEVDEHEVELAAMVEQMKTYGERWEQTLVAVKTEAVSSFLDARPDWNERLEAHAELEADARRDTLAALLPELEAHVRGRPHLWSRLEGLRSRAERASAAEWRLDVRRAALRRMRLVLQGIAGRVLLAEKRDPRRRALERLERCEAFEPGALPAVPSQLAETAFPPLAADRALLVEVLPSWLGVRFGPVPKSLGAERDLPSGAAYLQTVYPDSPAQAAGLEQGDVVIGPEGAAFRSYEQIREWTMTSQTGVPLTLEVVRPGEGEDLRFEVQVKLEPYPLALPEIPGPPQVGEKAPALPSGLESVGPEELTNLAGREHVLFFWATWCGPCKEAVPELLAFGAARGIPVLAISDERADVVRRFLEERKDPFFGQVAVDPRRRSFLTYGVNGTPSIFLVHAAGHVQVRQVGYSVDKGLTVEGWSWGKE